MNGQTKLASAPAAYSARQIALHWIVFVLVAFQFAIGNQMSHLFSAAHGGNSTRANPIWTPVHISVGSLLSSSCWRAWRCAASTAFRRRRSSAALEWRGAPCTPGSTSI